MVGNYNQMYKEKITAIVFNTARKMWRISYEEPVISAMDQRLPALRF